MYQIKYKIRILISTLFILVCNGAIGQKDNSYIVVLNKKYFTCYLNPVNVILQEISAWDIALGKYNDTIYCESVNLKRRFKSVRISIDLMGEKDFKVVFKRIKGSDQYKLKTFSDLHYSLDCSMFIWDYHFVNEDERIVVWYKDNEQVDKQVISINK